MLLHPEKAKQANYLIVLFLILLLSGLTSAAYSIHKKTQRDDMVTLLDIQNKPSSERAAALNGKYKVVNLTITRDHAVNTEETKQKIVARFQTEIADTPALQELGLSGREDLSSENALLFTFDKDGHYPFWMKDMNFSIDMIWIDADKKIVHIIENVKPETYPQTFQSSELARYVLEVADGVVATKKIKVGDMIEF